MECGIHLTSPILLRFQFHLPITTFIFVSFILLFALSLPSTPLYPNSAYDRFSLTIYSMPIAFQSQPSPLPFTPCQFFFPNSTLSLTIYSMPIAFQSQPSPLPFTPCQLPSLLVHETDLVRC